MKFLVAYGIRPENVRHVLTTIKADYGLAAAPEPKPDETSEAAWQFRRATKKSANKNHTVAGAPFEEFKAFAVENLWAKRTHNGYDHVTCPFTFIKETYGDWIKRGVDAAQPVSKADIKAVDYALYQRLAREIVAKGQPEWLYLPSAAEAALVGLLPEERDSRLQSREHIARVQQSRRRHEPNSPTQD